MTAVQRVYNFSAGPAVMPVEVLEEIQRDLVALPGVGMSILEVSHRSPAFESILAQAEADMRSLAGIPSNYRVLFLQGGASLQFSMVPMNLLAPGQTADYIDSGSWGDKAVKEAKKIGTVNIAATTKAENYARIPTQAELKLTPGAAYVHMTSNNTIEGTEYKQLPDVGDVPLVSDTSSDMFSRPLDVARHALIYAGAQKNMGPAGLTVVIIREDLLQRSLDKKATLPTMLNYAVHAENKSLYNTPPAFAVYALGLVMKWLIANGGLPGIARVNQRKAGEAVRRDRPLGVLPRDRPEGGPFSDEHHVSAAERGSGEAVRQGVDGGGAGRAEGAPVGRRHARVRLQCVSGGRRGRPGGVHEGIRAHARLVCYHPCLHQLAHFGG